MADREIIECVAIEFADLTLSLPRPNRHHHVIQRYHADTGKTGSGVRQGFMTSQGRFVDRSEAARLAFAAGQIEKPKPTLYSEDLW
jgi:hypothetical protein